MPLSFTPNLLPTTGAEAVFKLKTALKNAGWTVLRSSDGTTYNGSGDQITVAGSGAGGMANNSAWFVIRQPTGSYPPFTGTRQLCIQRANFSNNTQWRVKYSYSAGFSGGSPSSTQTPSAADEQILYGGGTDASPSFTTLYNTDGSYNLHIAVNATDPLGFWSVAYPTGGGNPNHVFMMDPMQAGFPSQDDDPYVFFLCESTPLTGGVSMSAAGYGTGSSQGPKGFLKHGLAGEGFVLVPVMFYAQTPSLTLVIPDGAGTNPASGKDDLLPVLYARNNGQTVPVGFKGVSTFMHHRSAARASGDTMAAPGTKDHVVIGQVVFDWDGTTVPNV